MKTAAAAKSPMASQLFTSLRIIESLLSVLVAPEPHAILSLSLSLCPVNPHPLRRAAPTLPQRKATAGDGGSAKRQLRPAQASLGIAEAFDPHGHRARACPRRRQEPTGFRASRCPSRGVA